MLIILTLSHTHPWKVGCGSRSDYALLQTNIYVKGHHSLF